MEIFVIGLLFLFIIQTIILYRACNMKSETSIWLPKWAWIVILSALHALVINKLWTPLFGYDSLWLIYPVSIAASVIFQVSRTKQRAMISSKANES